jgi:hypothetical protein
MSASAGSNGKLRTVCTMPINQARAIKSLAPEGEDLREMQVTPACFGRTDYAAACASGKNPSGQVTHATGKNPYS